MISRHFLCFNHHSFHHFRWFFVFAFSHDLPLGAGLVAQPIRVGPQTRRFCWENGDRVAWCLFVCWFLDVFVGQKGYCSVAALQCFFFFQFYCDKILESDCFPWDLIDPWSPGWKLSPRRASTSRFLETMTCSALKSKVNGMNQTIQSDFFLPWFEVT